MDEKHEKPYTVEVDYMDPKEMRDFLGDHLQSYRRCYFELERPKMMHAKDEAWIPADDADDLNGAEDGDDAKLTQIEIVKLQKAKQSAQETFKALFKEPDEPSREDLVRDDSPDAEAEILDALLEKTKKGLTNRPGGAETILYVKAPDDLGKDDLEECRDLLDLLTTDPRGDTPAIWPFIKLIRLANSVPMGYKIY